MSRAPSRRSRRALAAAVLATVAVVLLGVAGWPGVDRLRAAGGATLGPVLRALGSDPAGEVADLQRERDRLAEERRAADLRAGDRADLDALLASPTTAGATLVPAHVVAVGRAGAGGPERLTLDVGARDGVSVDSTVAAAGGLVGRVVSVAPWTCDVALLGAPDVVVGVRVGDAGRIGTVSPSGTGGVNTDPGLLRLELVEQGQLAVGDPVRTLGSVDGRPFVAGVEVGRVVAVDPLGGRATTTASVRPTVDLGSLGLVAVLQSAPRLAPRPAVTGGAQ